MSVHARFDNATPAITPVEMPPVVLRFAPLKPKQLSRFNMHDRRSGGDLNHVDLSLKTLNQIEHGDDNWIPKLKRRITLMADRNLKNEVRALKTKGRVAEAKRRQNEGPKSPWHANTDAPLREGILTVNKAWFGGTGADEWTQTRVDDFRKYAMAFLKTYFPGGQLIYAASHSDEEAFHIHFVTATWDTKTSGNRGQQIQLRAAANPILKSYEYAQDLAGAHFEKIGITRGERRAEARRKAKAAGLPAPEKRHHISPSEYREAERRKGRAEAAVTIDTVVEDCRTALKKTRQRASRTERAARRKTLKAELRLNSVQSEIVGAKTMLKKIHVECSKAEAARNSASETAGLILEDARDTGTKTLRKSRKRAVKEASARNAELARQAKAASEKRAIDERAAEIARQAEATALVQELRARTCASELAAKATAASDMLIQARSDRDVVLGELEQANTKRDAALLSADAAMAAETAALKNRNLLLAEAGEAEDAKNKAEVDAREAETQTSAMRTCADAFDTGLKYLAQDVIRYKPPSKIKSEGLAFSKVAPADKQDRQAIISRIQPVFPLLMKIARLIRTAVDTILARERCAIAHDIKALDEIRQNMGIGSNDALDDLRARYKEDENDPGRPDR